MKTQLRDIWNDIRKGQNVDIYLTILVCGVLIILDIFSLVSEPIVLSGILAILILIAMGTLANRQVNDKIRDALDNLKDSPAKKFFSEWDETYFKQRLPTARDVSLLSVSISTFINSNVNGFSDFLARDGKLRCIMVEPHSDAMRMVMQREVGAGKQLSFLSTQVEQALQVFHELAENAPNLDQVQVKLINHVPAVVLTIVDGEADDGIMFVTLTGFGIPWTSRPYFTLHKQHDEKWFMFYYNSFNNMWNWEGGRTIDLREV